MKILVIDDDPLMLKLLTHQLNRIGYSQVIALDMATVGIDLLRREGSSIGLILCDLKMPGMDGVEFVRQLANMQFAGSIVLISGEDERILDSVERLTEFHKLNVLGSLHKPISIEQLQDVLQSDLVGGVRAPQCTTKVYSAENIQSALNDNQLINYYQPKVDLGSRRVIGAEALVRWRHPNEGLVFPEQFLHEAEKEGLIDMVTSCVLRNALLDACLWKASGVSLSVSVNVSIHNLTNLAFPDVVLRIAEATSVPMGNIILEVAETRLMQDSRVPLDVLNRLRLREVGLSIDDFGTSHSSLSQLRDLPFSEVKADRSFVHGAYNDTASKAILQAMVQIARQLNMKAVAQGIENLEDWVCARAVGCDYGQGHYIGQPMAADHIPTWVENWNARRATLARVT